MNIMEEKYNKTWTRPAMDGLGENQVLQAIRPGWVNLKLPLLWWALLTDGWESVYFWNSNTEIVFFFTYLLSMYWARKLICVHVFDIVFVARPKWEINCVT